MNAEVIDCIYDSPKYDPKYDPPPSSDAVSGTGGKRVTLVFRDGTKVSGSTTKRNLPSPVATNDTNLQNRSVATEDDRIRGTKRKNEDKDKDAAPAVEKKAKTKDENILLIAKVPDLSVENIMKSCRTFGIDPDAFIRSLGTKTPLNTRFENISKELHISSLKGYRASRVEESDIVQIMNKYFAWSNQGMSIIEYTWKKNERGVLICEKYASHLMTHLRNRLKGFKTKKIVQQAEHNAKPENKAKKAEYNDWFVIWQESTDRINEDMFKKKVFDMGAILNT